MANDHVLLFLPDISGFTRFVERTDIDHGQHIISELIELLIAEDRLGLVVAEVEGDAVFFYSQGPAPTTEALVDQCRRMFLRFHGHLKQYATSRICDCGACSTAEQLTLKFVAHAGPVRPITVQGRSKPFGTDVILAHRLLKNKLAKDEYVLLTDALSGDLHIGPDSGMREIDGGRETYPDLPEVQFRIIDLSGLHGFVKEPDTSTPALPVSADPIRLGSIMKASPEEVFRTLIDLDKRAEWDAFAERIERPEAHINRPGSKHTCVLPVGHMQLETVSGGKATKGYEYVERALNIPFISLAYTRFTLNAHPDGTKVESETHLVPTNWMGQMMAPMAKRRLGRWVKESLERLGEITARESSFRPIEQPLTTTHQ